MDCKLRIGEEMILGILKNESDKEKFSKFLLNDEIKVGLCFKKIQTVMDVMK